MSGSAFTHFDKDGKAVMVDVSGKEETTRTATAKGRVIVQAETMKLIQEGGFKKGDVLSVARLAGIMGAKKTPDLIPLCHPLMLTSVKVDFELHPDENAIDIIASAQTAEAHVLAQVGASVGLTVWQGLALELAYVKESSSIKNWENGKSTTLGFSYRSL